MLHDRMVQKLGAMALIILLKPYAIFAAVEWQKVEQAAQNTVLQVWTQGSKKSWLEPYKAPTQYQVVGTAFFINSNGDMLTNFHVVEHANFVYVHIPSGGQKPYEVKVKGVCPEQDVALLELTEESYKELTDLLGSIPYLTLGNSDELVKTQPVMALGYPLGSRYLKSTIGEIAGCEYMGGFSYIHMTAAINHGNSGGPLLNRFGEVVGINTAGVTGNSICFILPINDISPVMKQLYLNPLYRKPRLDFRINPATKEHIEFFNGPLPGGVFINKVLRGSLAEQMGVKEGDMLYQIKWKGNLYDIDEYGDVKVDWRITDKISLRELMIRLEHNDPVDLVVYRDGKRLTLSTILTDLPKYPGRYIFQDLEANEMDYEVLFGTVFMQLRQNHVFAFAETRKGKQQAEAIKFKFEKYFEDPSKESVIITHIHNGSQLQKIQCFAPGDIINEINGKKVKNLAQLRAALLESVKTGYICMSIKEGPATVLSLDKVISEENRLSSDFGYPLTDTFKKLKTLRSSNLPR